MCSVSSGASSSMRNIPRSSPEAGMRPAALNCDGIKDKNQVKVRSFSRSEVFHDVKRIPSPDFFQKPFYVGARIEPEHVLGWITADKAHYSLIFEYVKAHPSVLTKTVLDFGANRGFYSLFAAALGFAEIHAWEIEPAMFQELQSGVSYNKGFSQKIFLHQIGISDRSMIASQVLSGGTGYLAPAATASADVASGIISMQLDCWAQTVNFFQVRHLGFVKIDVEGFETALLAGAQYMLLDPKVHISMLLVEVGPRRWARAKMTTQKGITLMQQLASKFSHAYILARGDAACSDKMAKTLECKVFEDIKQCLIPTAQHWADLLMEMDSVDSDCNFWFVND